MLRKKVIALCVAIVLIIHTLPMYVMADNNDIILNYASADYGEAIGEITVSGATTVIEDADGYKGKIAQGGGRSVLRYIPRLEKGVYSVFVHKEKLAYGGINIYVNSLYNKGPDKLVYFNWGYEFPLVVENDENGDSWVSIGTHYFSGVYGEDYVECSQKNGTPAYFDAIKFVKEEQQNVIVIDECQEENELGSSTFSGVAEEDLSVDKGGVNGTHMVYGSDNGVISATYNPKVSAGCYDVYVNIPKTSYNAEMSIQMTDGKYTATEIVPASPTASSDEYIENWYRVGVFEFGGIYGQDIITLTASPQSGKVVRFDAVKLVESKGIYAFGPTENAQKNTIVNEFNACKDAGDIRLFVDKYSDIMNLNINGLLFEDSIYKRLQNKHFTTYDELYQGISGVIESEHKNPLVSMQYTVDANEQIVDPIKNSSAVESTGVTEFSVGDNGYDGNTTGLRALWNVASSVKYIPDLKGITYEVYLRTNITKSLGSNDVIIVSGQKEVLNRTINWAQLSSETLSVDEDGNKWLKLGDFKFSGQSGQDYVNMTMTKNFNKGYAYYDTVKFVPVLSASRVDITDIEQLDEIDNMEVTVKLCGADFVKGETSAVAIYSDEERMLEGVTINTFDGITDYEASLGKIGRADSVKLICFEDLKSIKPAEIYGNSVDLYVSCDAKGGGTGTQDNPYTLKEAKDAVARLNDKMKRDIIVHLGKGIYNFTETERFGSELSGRNGMRVIFEGESGETFFSGGKEITNWNEENGLWTAELPDIPEIRQLYIDGKKAQRARSSMYTVGGIYQDENTDADIDGLVILKAPFSSYKNPEAMEIVHNVEWFNHRLPIKDVIVSGMRTTFVGDSERWAGLNSIKAEWRPSLLAQFYVENAIEYLDEPGEFYFDNKEHKLYYMPKAGEEIDSVAATAAVCEKLVEIAGTSYDDVAENITFRNISFVYGGYTAANEGKTPSSQGTVLCDNTLLPAQIELNNTFGINITDCEFKNLGSTAISLANNVVGSWIDSNTIADVGGAGIEIGKPTHTTYLPYGERRCVMNRISNNSITRCGDEFYSCPAIIMYYVGETTVENNEIYDVPYTGISMGWGWGLDVYHCKNNLITRNRIENVMMKLEDGAHIYTLGPCRNSEISENYLIGRVEKYGSMYADQGSSYMLWENNVADLRGNSGTWLHGNGYVHDMTVRNNYVTSKNITLSGDAEETFSPEDGILFNRNDIPDNVKQIIDNAGINDNN